jgi:hypothetical protein
VVDGEGCLHVVVHVVEVCMLHAMLLAVEQWSSTTRRLTRLICATEKMRQTTNAVSRQQRPSAARQEAGTSNCRCILSIDWEAHSKKL